MVPISGVSRVVAYSEFGFEPFLKPEDCSRSLSPLTQSRLATAYNSLAQPKELSLAVWLPETQLSSEPNVKGSMRTEDISKPHTKCKQSLEQKVGW